MPWANGGYTTWEAWSLLGTVRGLRVRAWLVQTL